MRWGTLKAHNGVPLTPASSSAHVWLCFPGRSWIGFSVHQNVNCYLYLVYAWWHIHWGSRTGRRPRPLRCIVLPAIPEWLNACERNFLQTYSVGKCSLAVSRWDSFIPLDFHTGTWCRMSKSITYLWLIQSTWDNLWNFWAIKGKGSTRGKEWNHGFSLVSSCLVCSFKYDGGTVEA